MNLGLRNWLAGRCLEALADDRADGVLRALARFAERADERGVAAALGDAEAAELARWPKLFERAGAEVRLAPPLVPDLPALRWRAARFVEAIAACRSACDPPPPAANGMPPSGGEIAWTLCAGAALFNVGLFFEVHELLEPPWGRAEGPLRLFLQGLIQIAAGLHHEQNGNRKGAVTLLAEGSGKLRPFAPLSYGVELAEFLPRISGFARALSSADPPVDLSIPPLRVRRAQESASSR